MTNRSVTFLKRKGGLFKKAHELSVLCSVDVAVIIFGHNKKLYEYSSGDINETIGRFQYVSSPVERLNLADLTCSTEEHTSTKVQPTSRTAAMTMKTRRMLERTCQMREAHQTKEQ